MKTTDLVKYRAPPSLLDTCFPKDTMVEFPDRDIDGSQYAFLDGLPADLIATVLFIHVGHVLQGASKDVCWAIARNLLRERSIKRRFIDSHGAWKGLDSMDRLSRGFAALWYSSGGWRSTNWITRAWDAPIRRLGDDIAQNVVVPPLHLFSAPPPSSSMNDITSSLIALSTGSSQHETPSHGTFLPDMSLPDLSAMSSTWAALASRLQPDANNNEPSSASSASSAPILRDLSLETGQGFVAAAARFLDELESLKLTTADGASAFAAAFNASAAMPSQLEAVARAIRTIGSIVPGSVPSAIPLAMAVGYRDRLVPRPLVEPRPPLPTDVTGSSSGSSSGSQGATTSASSSASSRKSKTKKKAASSKGAKTATPTNAQPNRLRKKKPAAKEETILRRSMRLVRLAARALGGGH